MGEHYLNVSESREKLAGTPVKRDDSERERVRDIELIAESVTAGLIDDWLGWGYYHDISMERLSDADVGDLGDVLQLRLNALNRNGCEWDAAWQRRADNNKRWQR